MFWQLKNIMISSSIAFASITEAFAQNALKLSQELYPGPDFHANLPFYTNGSVIVEYYTYNQDLPHQKLVLTIEDGLMGQANDTAEANDILMFEYDYNRITTRTNIVGTANGHGGFNVVIQTINGENIPPKTDKRSFASLIDIPVIKSVLVNLSKKEGPAGP